jgi:hypothetical protein
LLFLIDVQQNRFWPTFKEISLRLLLNKYQSVASVYIISENCVFQHFKFSTTAKHLPIKWKLCLPALQVFYNCKSHCYHLAKSSSFIKTSLSKVSQHLKLVGISCWSKIDQKLVQNNDILLFITELKINQAVLSES